MGWRRCSAIDQRPVMRHCRWPANSYMPGARMRSQLALAPLLETSFRETLLQPPAAEILALDSRHHPGYPPARHHPAWRRPVPAEPVARLDGRHDREGVQLRRAGDRDLDQLAGRLPGAVAAHLQAYPRPGSGKEQEGAG